MDDYLEHHGVQGMRWGVRRQMKKDAKYIKSIMKSKNAYDRQVSSGIRSRAKLLKKYEGSPKMSVKDTRKFVKLYTDMNRAQFNSNFLAQKIFEKGFTFIDKYGKDNASHFLSKSIKKYQDEADREYDTAQAKYKRYSGEYDNI